MKSTYYSEIPIQECGDLMVDLATFPFALEPVQYRKRYTNTPQLLLRKTAALRLQDVQHNRLDAKGLRFKIYDAWRPRDIQNKVYAACWNTLSTEHPEWDKKALDRAAADFVINGHDAVFVPPHSTGGAVDITLIRADTEEELDMGTRYCEWTNGRVLCPTDGADAEICDNLRELTIAMLEAGFVQDPEQWWHFDYGNQKWAYQTETGVAVYGELTKPINFMQKNTAFGHGMLLPYEVR